METIASTSLVLNLTEWSRHWIKFATPAAYSVAIKDRFAITELRATATGSGDVSSTCAVTRRHLASRMKRSVPGGGSADS